MHTSSFAVRFPLESTALVLLFAGCLSIRRPALDDSEWIDSDEVEAPDTTLDSPAPFLSLETIDRIDREVGFSDLGALTRVSNDVYFAASDTDGKACELKISVDERTGAIAGCRLVRTLKLENRVDVEGIAFDPLTGLVWAADEAGAVIAGHDADDGREKLRAPVPAVYARCHANTSLESLTIRPDGLEMWTCNEAPLAGDGAASTKESNSLVRLARFTRASAESPWRAAGQWAYPVGRMHGGALRDVMVRGVADLCALDDGTLLVLEREFSRKTMPRFRCGIYEVSFDGATEVSSLESLADTPTVPVKRRRLWATQSIFDNYEGMCLGERLADGSRSILLVSDGDGYASERILALRLGPARDAGAGKSE